MLVAPTDEGRHRAGVEPGWEESWTFQFGAADASLGAAIRLAVRGSRAWYWAHVAGLGRDLVAVRDHDIEPPRGSALEVRASGLWAELTCETPLDHWSAGLEALGVALDHPAEAYADERGQPVPVGADLEWEATGPCWRVPGAAGYLQPCVVHGEVLVGRERIAVDAPGARTHFWGGRDWWDAEGWAAEGRLDDGTAFAASGTESRARAAQPSGSRARAAQQSGSSHGSGVWFAPGGGDPAPVDAAVVIPADELPWGGTLDMGGTTLEMTVMAHAPVLVPAPDGRASRLWRCLVRFSAADGRTGTGWCERLVRPG